MTNPRDPDVEHRRLSRRRLLGGFGAVGLGALVSACSGGSDNAAPTRSASVGTTSGGTATVSPQSSTSPATAALFDDSATCTVTAEQTEGPYYFDVDSIRSDISEDRVGAPLRLAIRVQDASECAPVANAVVDIWHCDAEGLYSGFESASMGGGGGGRSDDETYLRGAQVTNADGIVEFRTVYPGWYSGRTVHIHTKVHLDTATLLTTQLYFDESVTAQVYAQSPYAAQGMPDTSNASDMVSHSGDVPMLTLSKDGAGWLGVITLGVA